MNRLKQVSLVFASEAFDTVEDPLDKLRILSFLIVATFYQVALSSSSTKGNRGGGNGGNMDEDWSAGKREAQCLFRQYITGFLEL